MGICWIKPEMGGVFLCRGYLGFEELSVQQTILYPNSTAPAAVPGVESGVRGKSMHMTFTIAARRKRGAHSWIKCWEKSQGADPFVNRNQSPPLAGHRMSNTGISRTFTIRWCAMLYYFSPELTNQRRIMQMTRALCSNTRGGYGCVWIAPPKTDEAYSDVPVS